MLLQSWPAETRIERPGLWHNPGRWPSRGAKKKNHKLPLGIEPGVLIGIRMTDVTTSKNIAEDLSANVLVNRKLPEFAI